MSLGSMELEMTTLADKVAIVTGASSGIGHATARLFAREGARLVVTARRRAELDALVTSIEEEGGHAIAVAGDIRDETLAKLLVETAVGRFGGLDVAFNNAGSTGEMAPVPDLSIAGWGATLETNLTSAFLGAKYQLPAMVERGGGSIVFTSTFVGYTAGMPGMAAYAAAKGGADRPGPGDRRRVRHERHPGKCHPARRHRHAGGPGGGQHPRDQSFPRGASCPQTHGDARRDRAIGALPRIGCLELHDRKRASGRRRGLDQPDLSLVPDLNRG
jgi:short chain dehydrogenase